MPQLGLARNFHSSARLELENSGSGSSLLFYHNSTSSCFPWTFVISPDPQAVNEGKNTAKDIAKSRRKTNVVDFLDKVDSIEDLFPLKEVSPLNFFAITDDSDGLIKHISAEHQTANYDANQEVITYVYFILQ